MMSDIVREGKAAWGRLKQGGGTWEDWKAVGHALLRSRNSSALRAPQARRRSRVWASVQQLVFDNRLNLSPTDRAMLFKVMEILPAVEAWRETLPPMRRLRMNHPSTVLKNYMKAIEIKPAPECVRSPSSPAQHERDDHKSHSRGIRLEPNRVTLICQAPTPTVSGRRLNLR